MFKNLDIEDYEIQITSYGEGADEVIDNLEALDLNVCGVEAEPSEGESISFSIVVKSKVVILGLTFKENCPDTRNSKVSDIYNKLVEYGIEPVVVDPWASEKDAIREYGITLQPMEEVKDADCVIFAVAHNEFKDMTMEQINSLYKDMPQSEKVLIDVKGLFDVNALNESGMTWWRL